MKALFLSTVGLRMDLHSRIKREHNRWESSEFEDGDSRAMVGIV